MTQQVEVTDRVQLEAAQARVENAAKRLQALLRQLTKAIELEEAADRRLTDKIHELNRAGVEGKNAAERDANLHAATTAERQAVTELRIITRRRRAAVERAQHTYDVARYRHRVWRVINARASGVGGEDTW